MKLYSDFDVLFELIRVDLIMELIEIFDVVERVYVKCLRWRLNELVEDEELVEEELLDDEGGEGEEDMMFVERRGKELRLERVFCELVGKYVFCILVKMFD